MKRHLLCIVISMLLVASLLFAAVGCTQEKKLSAMSREDQLEFLAEQGVEVPDMYADYIISFIARVEEDPKDQTMMLAISNPVLIDLCYRTEVVVCEYYGYDYTPTNPLINDYRDPERMTNEMLYAILYGDGEDLLEAVNFDGFLDLALKYGFVESIEKDDVIDSMNDICEEFQDVMATEPDAEWGYRFSGESSHLSKSEIEAVRDEIDPDDSGLEIEDITVCYFKITKGDEDYDFGSIGFIKVDGKYMMYSTVQM